MTAKLLPFTKMQGVGNDFVVVEDQRCHGEDYSRLATGLCERRVGVGADGLLAVGPSSMADVRMQMFNPDGSADMCGNGLRCVVRYALERMAIGSSGTQISVETIAGIRNGIAVEERGSVLVSVDMGRPAFDLVSIPMVGARANAVGVLLDVADDQLTVTALSTGSTHCVLLVDELPSNDVFFRLGPQIENHPAFPQRTSAIWARVDSDCMVSIRIWERGAGETLGCGTGACAAAVTAQVHDLVRSPVTVKSAGGELRVEWALERDMVLTGPAEFVFDGHVTLDAC